MKTKSTFAKTCPPVGSMSTHPSQSKKFSRLAGGLLGLGRLSIRKAKVFTGIIVEYTQTETEETTTQEQFALSRDMESSITYGVASAEIKMSMSYAADIREDNKSTQSTLNRSITGSHAPHQLVSQTLGFTSG